MIRRVIPSAAIVSWSPSLFAFVRAAMATAVGGIVRVSMVRVDSPLIKAGLMR